MSRQFLLKKTVDIAKIKAQFPIFQNHPTLVYLDNASTTQTPQIVIDLINDYYTHYRSNIHRGVYTLSEQATTAYEVSRSQVAQFINASPKEIIFTSGTTAALNQLASTLPLSKGDNIVLTRFEHHANLIPWQVAAKHAGAEIRFIELTKNYEIDLENAQKIIDKNTKIVSFSLVSNVLGTHAPAAEIIALAKKYNAITIIDAAQGVAHEPIDVQKLDCDFLIFSSHKMYGPTGVGILYGKPERLHKLPPFLFGGDMIEAVSYTEASYAEPPNKFEAGTPNIAGVIGLGAAVDFIQNIGWRNITAHEQSLSEYALNALQNSGAQIIGSPAQPCSVISFTLPNIHPHDIAEILNRYHICIRAGHHCAMPLMKYLGLPGTARISLGIYNTKEDIDELVKGLTEVKKIFK